MAYQNINPNQQNLQATSAANLGRTGDGGYASSQPGFGGVPLKVEFDGGSDFVPNPQTSGAANTALQAFAAGQAGAAGLGQSALGGAQQQAQAPASGSFGQVGFGGVGLTAGAYQQPSAGLLAGTQGGGFQSGGLQAGQTGIVGGLQAAQAATGGLQAQQAGVGAQYSPAQYYSEGSPQYRQIRNQENYQTAQQAGLAAQSGLAGQSLGGAQAGGIGAQAGGLSTQAGFGGGFATQAGGLSAQAGGFATQAGGLSAQAGGFGGQAGYSPAQNYVEGSPQYRQIRNQENYQAAQQAGLTNQANPQASE